MSQRSREISRGEISLAVAAFIVVVGTAAGYAISEIPVQEKALIAAAAGEQTVVGKDCADTKKAAANRGGPDTGGSSTFKDETNFKDTCVAAVLKKNVPQPPNIRSAESYECVGKVVKVSIKYNGSITETWQPKPGQLAGLCTVTACGPTGKNCVAVKGGLAGLDTNKLKEYVNPLSSAYQTAEAEGLATRFDVTKEGTIDPRTLSQENRSVLSEALFSEDYPKIDATQPQPIFEPVDKIQGIANTDYWQQQGQSFLETNTIVNEYGKQWLSDYWQSEMQPYFEVNSQVNQLGEQWATEYSGGFESYVDSTQAPSSLSIKDAERTTSVNGNNTTGFDKGGVAEAFSNTEVPEAPQVPDNQSINPLEPTVAQPAPIAQEVAQQSPAWTDPFVWNPPATEVTNYNVPIRTETPAGNLAGSNASNASNAISGIADIAGSGDASGQRQGGQTFASGASSAIDPATPRAVWDPQPDTPWGPVTRGLKGTPAPIGSVASGVSDAFNEGGVGTVSAFPGEVVDITQPFGQRRIAYALNQNLLDAVTLNPAVESRSIPSNSWAGTPVVTDDVQNTYVAAAGSKREAVASLPEQFTMTWAQSTFITL
jgi:hypothetical protein